MSGKKASREQVQSLTEMTRSMRAQKATRISPAAMMEVMRAVDGYWQELEASDLSPTSKVIYMTQVDNFVSWMRGEFVPGSRNDPDRSIFLRRQPRGA
jgi:hypothetical protein